MTNRHMKRHSMSLATRKSQNHNEILPLPTRTECLHSKRQVSLSVGEDVELLELSLLVECILVQTL